jgi:hypothetical protein
MRESENNKRPLRIGSAAVREAGLCPAAASHSKPGLRPRFGLRPTVRNEEELR